MKIGISTLLESFCSPSSPCSLMLTTLGVAALSARSPLRSTPSQASPYDSSSSSGPQSITKSSRIPTCGVDGISRTFTLCQMAKTCQARSTQRRRYTLLLRLRKETSCSNRPSTSHGHSVNQSGGNTVDHQSTYNVCLEFI